jgi:hypothetical protein
MNIFVKYSMRKKSSLPATLYYNCSNPVKIITGNTINCSDVFTGVSMSVFFDLGSHGPFKISFKQSPWFEQFIRVMYWQTPARPLLRKKGVFEDIKPRYYINQDNTKFNEESFTQLQEACLRFIKEKGGNESHLSRVWKISTMFADEQEWYSPLPVTFNIEDIDNVMFMENAPNILGPIVTKRLKKILRETLGSKFVEGKINDPYLKSCSS